MRKNEIVTRQEQEQMGLIPPQAGRFVPAREQNTLSDADRSVLGSALGAGADMMTHRQQTHHAHSDDTALTNAFASLFYSLAYAVAFALITGGLLLAGWMFVGGEGQAWLLAWLVVWGICSLAALAYNRWQGLWFSPPGIAHHEIDSRERVAMHAIDRHADIIEKRLGLADDSNVVDVPPNRRISG
jgi:hypothetical protein